MSKIPQLNRKLRCLRFAWQSSLFCSEVLRLSAWSIILLIVFAVLDRLLNLSSFFIRSYSLGLLILVAIVLFIRLVRMGSIRIKDVAIRADHYRISGRPQCRTACELLRHPTDNEFQQYLISRQAILAKDQLAQLNMSRFLPMSLIRHSALQLILASGIGLCCYLWWTQPLLTALSRLRHPDADIPPYSRYSFTLYPTNPTVIYGGTIELAAEIEGPKIQQQVELISFADQHAYALTCFQDGERRFVQRLNQLTQPVSFCFRMGRARSPRIPIEVLLQPQIESSSITITPPAYSKKPARSFTPGSEPVRALRYAKLQLDIRSNRPLLDGVMMLTDTPDDEQRIAGKLIDQHTLRFDWQLDQSATLTVSIRDVRGTENIRPLEFSQEILPDENPEVTLFSPGTKVLATPMTKVPLAATASDDLGLEEVFFVRTIDAFRDRETPLARELDTRTFNWESQLDLGALGVTAGQIIECYLEARDNNPTLSGMAASSIGRIEIIAEETYAELLRVQMGIQEFTARFNATEAAMQLVIRKLNNIMQQADNPHADLDMLRKDALDAIDAASKLYQQLEQDYAVYDEEKQLSEAMNTALKQLEQARSMIHLTQTPAQSSNMKLAAGMAWEELQPVMQNLSAIRKQAEQQAQVANLMECAARFRRLIGLQQDLTRRLQRFQDATPQRFLSTLRYLGEQQHIIKEEYLGILSDLRERADQLPDGFDDLFISANEFADMADSLNINKAMQSVQDQAETGHGPASWRNAEQVVELLQKLLAKTCGSCYGGMCQRKFRVPDYDQTLKNMLKSLCKRYGTGDESGGQGQGAGGSGSGYWMPGYGLTAPMLGPQRSHLNMGGSSGVQGQHGTTGIKGTLTPDFATEKVTDTTQEKPAGETRSIGTTPPEYENAIRRYFTDETTP